MSVLLLFVLARFAMPVVSASLTVTFTNLEAGRGQLFIAVYDRPEVFLQDGAARIKKVVAVSKAGSLRLELGELPRGTYAVSCFHDVNGNGKMDKNFLGIPSEPYGFSNNARPAFRAPNWDEAKFQWSGTEAISIKLEKW